MHAEPLPYGLEPVAFPFPSLALLAGRLPLGGGREVALATLMTARLAASLHGANALSAADRSARASAAKIWLASLALPANTRVPFVRCIDATTGSGMQVAGALRNLLAATSTHLDGLSVAELDRLIRQLSTPS
ncbi:MAG TPA: hypothetical protein VE869_04190 [Gemmatimonas sp.]|nr:hypothetical protein [Gemmatimonas sp.]